MLRNKLYDFFQTHKVLNLTSLAEFLTANGVALDDDDTMVSKFGINVDIATDVDLLGKAVNELQYNINIDYKTGKITGLCYYIDDYIYYGSITEQSGNYLALRIDAPDVDEIEIVGLNENSSYVKLDDDNIYILRLDREESQDEITITAYKGTEVFGRVFNFADLELEEDI